MNITTQNKCIKERQHNSQQEKNKMTNNDTQHIRKLKMKQHEPHKIQLPNTSP